MKNEIVEFSSFVSLVQGANRGPTLHSIANHKFDVYACFSCFHFFALGLGTLICRVIPINQ